MAKTEVLICPYCGDKQPASERCRACGGLFEPLSRQATHNAMGPWFVRDSAKPFHPGCGYETLVRLIDRGQVTKYSIVRGPTTKQFWTVAKHVPGVAHLLGYCHNCDASVDPEDHGCHSCGVSFGAFLDRNFLGLPEVRPLPWEARLDPEESQGQAYQWGRPGGDGRISHFASDDELLAAGPAAGGGPAPAMAAAREVAAPTGEPHSSPSRHDLFDDYASAALTRALQRKLDSQRRTIRLLAVVLIAGTLVAIGFNAASLAGLVGRGAPAGTKATPPAQPALAEEASTAAEPGPAGSDGEAQWSGSAQEIPPPSGLQEKRGDAAPGPPPATAEDEADSARPASAEDDDYEQARGQLAAAREAERPLGDRIASYERALEILEKILASTPADEQPPALAETIAEVEREVERLRLDRDFFGSEKKP